MTYVVYGETGPNLKQVLRTYAFVLLLAFWAYGGVKLIFNLEATQLKYGVWVQLFPFVLPASVPALLRRRARKLPISPMYFIGRVFGGLAEVLHELWSMPPATLLLVAALVGMIAAVCFGLVWLAS